MLVRPTLWITITSYHFHGSDDRPATDGRFNRAGESSVTGQKIMMAGFCVLKALIERCYALKRRKLTIITILVLGLFLFGGLVYASQVITITIDGNRVESDVAPHLVSGRTLVPLRAIAEYFGADVDWVQETMTVEINSPYQKFLDGYGGKGMYIKQADEVLSMVNADTAVVLDVRGDALRDRGYITGSMHIPMPQLLERLDELPGDKAIAVYCTRNINASYAVTMLNMQGYEAYLLEDGMNAWLTAGGRNSYFTR